MSVVGVLKYLFILALTALLAWQGIDPVILMVLAIGLSMMAFSTDPVE